MASYCGIRRICYGWCLCLCVLLSAVESQAATRKTVSVPSAQTQFTKATAVGGTAESITVTGPVLEGEYIAASAKNVPVRGIYGGVTTGYRTVASGLKAGLKANLASLLLQATVGAAVAGVGWVMTDGVLVKKTQTSPDPTPKDYHWVRGTNDAAPYFNNGVTACQSFFTSGGTFQYDHIVYNSNNTGGTCYAKSDANGVTAYSNVSLYGSGCTSPAIYDSTSRSCQIYSETPVSDSDMDMLDPWLATQSAAWLTDLLKDVCNGSNNPGSCFEGMKTGSKQLIGPASVSGGTQTTTSTYTKADGTTGTKTQNQDVTYNLTYGDNYFDYSKTTTTTDYTDGEKTGEASTSDGTEVTDEQPADDSDDNPTASPCSGTNCDGPAYTDLYTPTTDTKESAIDSYKSKVDALPIISAAKGFFSVSVSATCPVWESTSSLDLMGHEFAWDLKFDYHCQSWFTSYQAFAVAVVLLLSAWAAFYIAVLD